MPVGSYTREVLARIGPAQAHAIERNIRSNEPDVAGVVGKVAQGAVDAGFVYVTDVQAAQAAGCARSRSPRGCTRRSSTGSRSSKGTEHPDAGAVVRRGPARRATVRQALRGAGFEPPAAVSRRGRAGAGPALLVGATAVTLCFLTLPVVAIFVDAGPGELLASLDDPGGGRRARS